MVGNFKTVQSVLKVQDKTAKTLGPDHAVVDPAYPVTSPDTVVLQGVLDNGAVASLSLRSSRSAVDDTGFRWLISGTKGEIELTTKPGVIQFLPPGTQIRLRTWGADSRVVDFDVDEEEYIRNVPAPGINVARVWEAFAKGEEDGYTSIEESLPTHELLETIIQKAVWAP